MTRMCADATTAVLGRVNAEGFLAYWPPVADDEDADPRDRGYARWLVATDKVVLSTTLAEAPWERTRVVDAPAADVVTALRASGEGEILVNSSAGPTRRSARRARSRWSTTGRADRLADPSAGT